ncbi:hypothetical protein FRB94_004711 [Tulasnella sp. JGI-2019a]|nr:hypothetical protein FRB94_004711 [Tulasnella sp. JGI-2019a]
MASKQETDTTEPTLRPVPGEPPALQTVQKQPGSDISNNASRLHTTGDSDTMLPHRQRVTVQCRLYAAEKFSASPFLASTIGFSHH